MEKKRKYCDDYIKLGFTVLSINGIDKPQCVLCNVVLSVEALKPSKLKRHFETKHPEHINKGVDFFKRHEADLKRQRFDANTGVHLQNTAVLQASYEAAFEIAKNKKPHTIGETLIKPSMLKMVSLVLGEASAAKMRQVSLSNNTVQRRIADMSEDVKQQVFDEINQSPLFAIQLDESTDVNSCAQLLVFAKYMHKGDLKEEFLFCSDLETTTKSGDILAKIESFFISGGLQWEKLIGVCTDGAPAMLGSKSGFQKKVKDFAPNVRGVHCLIHRYALATKTMPEPLLKVLDSVIKIVNFIKSGALNTRLFKELCKEMNSDHEVLLFHTAVRWLSKGNVLNRVYELKNEIKIFLETHGKLDLFACFNEEGWNKRLAYLADIFEHLNSLNLKLQGKQTNLILFQDNLNAFVAKVQNWRRKVNVGNVAMFERLCSMKDQEATKLETDLKLEIIAHLDGLEKQFHRYFPELDQEDAALVRNPFAPTLDVASLPDQIQDKYLDLRNDSSSRDLFDELSLNQFWCTMYKSYPKVALQAFKVLIPFASTYLCESGFSTLLQIKSKTRNKLNVGDDMRIALSITQPRIIKLVAQMQVQQSH